MNIQELIHHGSRILKENDVISYSLDSEILMSKAIQRDRGYIMLNLNKKVDKKISDYFKDLIFQRSTHKPIAYILGKKSFWNYEFNISSDVLIPRPDTEIIVEKVLEITKNKSKQKILDIGTGSGCILLTILKEKQNFYGTGIDISKKCIDITRINAIKLGVYDRLKLIKSDIDNFNYGKYDLIISNPPYIKKADLKYLEKDVVNFEPILALNGGLEGLSEIRKVINKASKLIKTRGKLVLEIAFNQKYEIKKILNEKGFYINSVAKDYADNDRCIISTKI
jgi:release factor glutamine methyltransferase